LWDGERSERARRVGRATDEGARVDEVETLAVGVDVHAIELCRGSRERLVPAPQEARHEPLGGRVRGAVREDVRERADERDRSARRCRIGRAVDRAPGAEVRHGNAVDPGVERVAANRADPPAHRADPALRLMEGVESRSSRTFDRTNSNLCVSINPTRYSSAPSTGG